ncbi:uncharacterized protein AMSG_03999 [Thecamonas trahens ATCC 50062]|uniref:Ras-GAP domain-containing protein n=1 Tax=Thecamonas trahens ATCC 50062 TaxID=461836 RepID=A0A0L0D5W1_THETB|nr:hypothetical protein AMSG_03999 [Thecamonas trahens ATCC 50062]KNC47772.1 hypothetical protein AMSG_03999 [Thecamonas trahens ATCC 50062]|eukprot:XP_013759250.1 hypothetical protein AMSG_03999 [Thecamonas trahens ATCC 50062]
MAGRWTEVCALRDELRSRPECADAVAEAEQAFAEALAALAAERDGGSGSNNNSSSSRGKGLSRSRLSRPFVTAEEAADEAGGALLARSVSGAGLAAGEEAASAEEVVGKMALRFPSVLMTKRLRRYKPLLKVVLHSSYLAVSALLRTMPHETQEAVPELVVRVFEDRGSTLALLTKLVETEVGATTTASTLFRTNSASTKLMKAYSKEIGKPYLATVVAPLIVNLLAAFEAKSSADLVFPHEARAASAEAITPGGMPLAPPPPKKTAPPALGVQSPAKSKRASVALVAPPPASAATSPLLTTNVANGRKYSLHVREGPLKGGVYPLTTDAPVKIGRSKQRGNTIVIPGTGQLKELGDDSVSKEHAALEYDRQRDCFVLRNLSSTNQIFVRTNTPVTGPDARGKKEVVVVNSGEDLPVADGFLIRVGIKSKFAVVVQELLEDEAASSESGSTNAGASAEPNPDGMSKLGAGPAAAASAAAAFEDDLVFQAACYVVDWIVAQVDATPIKFMDLCYQMRRIVVGKFPSAELTPVVGFFFLRFVCPAIVSPHEYGLLPDAVPGPLRVMLVKVAKILQSLANRIISGAKSQDMVAPSASAAANAAFAQLKTHSVRTFLLNISKTAPAKAASTGSGHINERDCRNLFYHFVRGRDAILADMTAIVQELRDAAASDAANELSDSLAERLKTNLTAALAGLQDSDHQIVAAMECTLATADVSYEDAHDWLVSYLPPHANADDVSALGSQLVASGLLQSSHPNGFVEHAQFTFAPDVSKAQSLDVLPFINDLCTLFQLFEASDALVSKSDLVSIANCTQFQEWVRHDREARRRLAGSFCLLNTNMEFFFSLFSMVKYSIDEFRVGSSLSRSRSSAKL